MPTTSSSVSATITPTSTLTLRRFAGVLWTTLLTSLRRMIGDGNAEVHTDTTLYRWMEHAELFLTLHRYLLEDTRNLALLANTPIYTIHSSHSDFIKPLRMDISGTPLLRANFTSITQLGGDDWFTESGTPERYYMVGTTLMGFHPVPTASTNVNLTYLRAPPARDATENIQPSLPDEWHTMVLDYAAGVAKLIEGNLERANEHFSTFAEKAGLARDWRFMSAASQRPAEDVVERPLAEAED